ncbi:MAG TPA: reverse transcriptase/maturase family protein [Candidatus Tectomicrobia bacterium]
MSRSLVEAYYEPQCSDRSHGFRPNRGGHTALRDVRQHGQATKWFIEGDLCACFDRIAHAVLEGILPERFHDHRFLRLMRGLLKAGYLAEWTCTATYSGVPHGGVVSPMLSHLVLDRWDKYVETQVIPAYTSGCRRRMHPSYARLLQQADKARNQGDWPRVRELRQQAQCLPSRDPHDPDFRRLWYGRYADDMLLGLPGSQGEAEAIKQQLTTYLRAALHLERSAEKTLGTHAREDRARFLGYEVHVLYADDKHAHRGQRCSNGSIGRRVPPQVPQAKRARYRRREQPRPLPERTLDDAYSISAQYQAAYRGVVQYYRLAYNLHVLSHLQYVMDVSLVQT